MKCSECSQYSYQHRRCLQGKINPSTIKGGKEAAKIMGIEYICNMAPRYGAILQSLCKEMTAARSKGASL